MSDEGQTITRQEQETIQEENLIENILEEEPDEKIIFRYSITSYGADYTLDSLVRRIQDGSIYVPSFQRAYVWKIQDASRFIESLLLGLPVPGIFLSNEQDTQKLLVIDGLQRLRTLQYFYEGIFAPAKKEFALKDVNSNFEGLPTSLCHQNIGAVWMIRYYTLRLSSKMSLLMITVASIRFLNG